MTVTVRPIPARAWSNGIKPFQAIKPANNIRPYTLKTWRPPVPEPLPPAPLLGIPSLLALGALVLSQIWGLFGSKPATKTSAPPPGTQQADIPVPTPSPGMRWDVVVFYKLQGKTFGGSCGPLENGRTFDGSDRVVSATGAPWRLAWTFFPASSVCNPSGAVKPLAWLLRDPVLNETVWHSGYVDDWSTSYWEGDLPLWVAVEPGKQPEFQVNYPENFIVPSPKTEPTPQPKPVRSPAVVPLFPLPLPETATEQVPGLFSLQTGPDPAPFPAPAPIQARPPAPLRVPAAVPLTTAGRLPAPVPAAVPVTDPEAHYPVPGAPPVTGAGTRSTPAAMAQELGRMEQKVARLLNPGPGQGADGTDRLQLLSELASRLLELLTSLSAGGSYEISSPCELDPDGDRIVTEVPYSGSLSALGVIGNKVDALAELLQAHKDLKQPICRPAPAAGQPVTVQFEQVE